MTCKKAQGFLEQEGVEVAETVDAKKLQYSEKEALELAASVDRIVAMKGKKVDILEMKDKPDREAILALLLGPTGNLRAPVIRAGRVLIVGFQETEYGKYLSS